MLLKKLLLCTTAMLTIIACNQKQQVDLIVYNANIYTIDSLFTQAKAMAISNGKIVAVGNADSLQNTYNTKEKLDANGQYIYPGFIDAHCHFLAYAKGLQECNLYGSTSWDDVLKRLADFAKTADSTKWLIGRGWDQNDWPNKAFPTNELLTKQFPTQPVMLTRVDGHAVIANDAALKIAGIVAGQVISGGEVLVQNGKLTGVLIDNATELVEKKVPITTDAEMTKYLQQAQQNCFATGLTSVQECGLDAKQVALVETLYKSSQLAMRMYIMLSDKKENYEYLFARGKIQTDQLTVNSFKLYADGALGSRGACLLQPYADQKNYHGFLLKSLNYYDSILPIIALKGFQACTHAIGDSANRAILNIYTKVLQNNAGLRWRIEHAQVLNPADFAKFGASHIIPSVQPTHATSDMYWAGQRLGNRLGGAYAYNQLLQQNGWMPLGTDFPVEDISTFKTFLAAVVRKDAKGYPQDGFQKENAISREQALRGMTIWAAKAAFEEQLKGSLEPGKLADFILLDKNLMTCADTDILQTKVLKTFSGGKLVYASK
jgi:predicted amidohydrolase YtcJ